MELSSRRVLPEVLDGLAPDDPRGLRARRDLQRVHAAMRSVTILRRAIAGLRLRAQPARLLELGAGDGTLLLRLARSLRPPWNGVELTLLDRQSLMSAATRRAFRELGWRADVLCMDALEWAARGEERRYDLCFANLFLHHFPSGPLEALLRAVAAAANGFVACEPRRGRLALFGSRLVGLLGANEVTREDAVLSVVAGFAGQELSTAWGPAGGGWTVREFAAAPFTHCFTAVRAQSLSE